MVGVAGIGDLGTVPAAPLRRALLEQPDRVKVTLTRWHVDQVALLNHDHHRRDEHLAASAQAAADVEDALGVAHLYPRRWVSLHRPASRLASRVAEPVVTLILALAIGQPLALPRDRLPYPQLGRDEGYLSLPHLTHEPTRELSARQLRSACLPVARIRPHDCDIAVLELKFEPVSGFPQAYEQEPEPVESNVGGAVKTARADQRSVGGHQ